MRACAALSTEHPFRTIDSQLNFENERWLLNTETVHRTRAFFDTSRWVVTMTDKSSGQFIALLTGHPSFTTDPWNTSLKFSRTAEGFSYTNDVASFSMKWPEIDFHYQKGFEPGEGYSAPFYLGSPRR